VWQKLVHIMLLLLQDVSRNSQSKSIFSFVEHCLNIFSSREGCISKIIPLPKHYAINSNKENKYKAPHILNFSTRWEQ
jgi:hypothetical protein